MRNEGVRAQMLLAALDGLGRLDPERRDDLSRSAEVDLDRTTGLTRQIDLAAQRGEAGTVMLLAAYALQADRVDNVSPVYLAHLLAALRTTGQDFVARMIAAEAISRIGDA